MPWIECKPMDERLRFIARLLEGAHDPSGLWCADYKGEFMLGNKQYCYPRTITDYRSRYLLACVGVLWIPGRVATRTKIYQHLVDDPELLLTPVCVIDILPQSLSRVIDSSGVACTVKVVVPPGLVTRTE